MDNQFGSSALVKPRALNDANTMKVKFMNNEFTKGKRGPVIPPDPRKTRITIRLDADILEHFKEQVHAAGGGNYQTLINNALREQVEAEKNDLEKMLRKIIGEELKKAS